MPWARARRRPSPGSGLRHQQRGGPAGCQQLADRDQAVVVDGGLGRRRQREQVAEQRAALVPQIEAAALAWAVGVVEAPTIDEIGIAPATRLAMTTALEALAVRPDYLLIDWVRLPLVSIQQHSQPKADQTIASVAAASILAKVHRDHIMVELADRYPAYGFAAHKGYGAAAHLAALARALAPRDLAVLDLVRRVDAARAQPPT